MIIATSVQKGAVLLYQGEICTVTAAQFVNPGKGSAFVRTKLKYLKSGRVIEKTFKSSDKLEQIELEKKEMQYLYTENDQYVFMNTNDYDQVHLPQYLLEDWKDFLIDEMICQVNIYQGNPVSITPPTFVDVTVTNAPGGLKGNTAGTARKRITVETGAEVLVPLYIQNNDIIRVDLRDFSFVERVNSK